MLDQSAIHPDTVKIDLPVTLDTETQSARRRHGRKEVLLSYLCSNRNVSEVAGVVTRIRSTDVELGALFR